MPMIIVRRLWSISRNYCSWRTTWNKKNILKLIKKWGYLIKIGLSVWKKNRIKKKSSIRPNNSRRIRRANNQVEKNRNWLNHLKAQEPVNRMISLMNLSGRPMKRAFKGTKKACMKNSNAIFQLKTWIMNIGLLKSGLIRQSSFRKTI